MRRPRCSQCKRAFSPNRGPGRPRTVCYDCRPARSTKPAAVRPAKALEAPTQRAEPETEPETGPEGAYGASDGQHAALGSLIGSTEPRLFTEPLRPLTPETSQGFALVDFADRIGMPLLPWQRWLAVHALELLPDGSPRFRTVIVPVARQNGKTSFVRALMLYTLFVRRVRLVLTTAQNLDIAREGWQGAVDLARGNSRLRSEIAGVRLVNGQETLTASGGGRIKVCATTRGAGRGLSVDLLIADEIREQRDWSAWSALSKTTMARPNAQVWALSNAGDDQSVVLNSLRDGAINQRDPSVGLFEWSAPDGAALDDVDGWRAANPALGLTISESAIRSALATDPPSVFRTEVLCQRVDALDGAIDTNAWGDCRDAGDLRGYRDRLVLGIDVAPDGQHVTAVIAAETADDRVRVELARSWRDFQEARSELPGIITRLRPRSVVWFPSGPAAALGTDLRGLGVNLVALTGTEVSEACQAFAALVSGRRVLQPGDALLDAHIAGAHKLRSGDGWRFVRSGNGHVDAAYALAGAVHGVRNLPVDAPVIRPIMVVAG